ncbi:RNA pyrophosphohydrolase [Sphingomonas japonica]|uniref:RNA pyrophosphohydrolase n=1 Tax=Sphingomonas japonica TaxID=511662 RepID=A0ABX0U684_9SPHN|nr:RNA pyrophosphohydrolase [Sphingomonas japonica]NIJ25191.1 putative (di)nucleoside polyphosphate hydrolase [Sphingomonas japonica]
MTDPIDRTNLPYRPCAGAMLLNRHGQVFVGQRLDSVLEAWQMPQGGIDPGEAPLAAAIREIGEETGIAPRYVELIAQAPDELEYDLPDDLIGKVWKGKWRGQRQRWFLFAFTGEDSDIDIATPEPEFRAWRWVEPAELPDLIVPFKRALYQTLLEVFEQPLRTRGRLSDHPIP